MRIASLQPSVSLTLAYLGRLESLCAVTSYCLAAVPELPAHNLPVLADAWSFDRSLESLSVLQQAKPDLVIGCIPFRPESLTAVLKCGLPVLTLAPTTLTDIEQNAHLLARLVEAIPEADALIADMRAHLALTREQTKSTPHPLVYAEEWGKPLIHSQLWVSELVTAAGGRFLGEPGAHASAETIATADPDVLLFAWCGAGDRVPLERIIVQRGWQHLRAVRERRVFCIPDELLNTPSFNLRDGLRAIAGALHPGLFPAHPGVRQLAADTLMTT